MAVKTGAEHPEVPAHKNVPKTAANYEHVAAMEALEKLAERVREAGRIMDEMARLLMRSKDDQRDLRMRREGVFIVLDLLQKEYDEHLQMTGSPDPERPDPSSVWARGL